MNSLHVAIAFLTGWTLLAIVMFIVFLRLMVKERDTRIAAEINRTPDLELIGRANINRSSWSLKNMGRLSLYDSFLVASCRSRRVILPYDRISNIESDACGRLQGVRIQGPKDGQYYRPDIRFAAPDIGRVAAIIAAKQAGT
jgi:hypothetical protein